MSLSYLPGLLTAILYGFVAEKYGRRIVLLLAITGILLMLLWIIVICPYPRKVQCWRADKSQGHLDTFFPVRLIWISSIFLFIGGGQRVFCSMIYAIISDSHGPSTRYGIPLESLKIALTELQDKVSLPVSCRSPRLSSDYTAYRRRSYEQKSLYSFLDIYINLFGFSTHRVLHERTWLQC